MTFERAGIPGNLIDRVEELEKRLADLSGDAVTPVPAPDGGDTTIIVNGKHVVQDEGTSLPARSNLNFEGAGVTAVDDEANDETTVIIPGGGGGAATSVQVDTKANLEALPSSEGQIGFSSDSHELGLDNGSAWEWLSGHLLSLLFGDGSDGDVTIAVDTTLSRTMYYNSLTVNSGVSLYTVGFKIFVRSRLTNNGTIAWDDPVNMNGANGGNGTDIAGGAGGGEDAGSGGAPSTNGQNGADDSDPLMAIYGNAQSGLNGAAGGDGATNMRGVGGLGGTASLFGGFINGTNYHTISGAASVGQISLGPSGTFDLFAAKGNGGAGGGGGGTNGGGGGGGGRGRTPSYLAIIAYELDNQGTIRCAGGNGGDGGNGYAENGGGGAGGGGGNGGIILSAYFRKITAGTTDVTGGAHGDGGTGVNAGTDGLDGLPGVVIEVH